MSLSSALNVAQSSLTATSTQTSILSRNVAGADNPHFNRKNANLVTTYGGAVRVNSIGRAMDTVLFTARLNATASTSTQQAIVDALDQLEATVNDPELDQSLAAKLGNLTNALQQYGVTPDDPLLAQNVLAKATELVRTLNEASDTVRTVRRQADADMAAGVERVNALLVEFEAANLAVVKGSQAGIDVTDQLDTRDRILSQLSEDMGISVSTRANNDMVIYTDGGVTLFETVPRKVSMAPSFGLGAGTAGNAVYVDGVPVIGPGAIMPVKSGQIYGSAIVRDEITVTYQTQLDEIARGLIEVFAETDQSGGGGAPQAGLFTYGAPPAAIPAAGTAVAGLASQIRVNGNVDPAQGGDLDLLRDGGISDPADPDYNYNASGAAGFPDRIQGLLTALGTARGFDSAAGADPTNTLVGFAGFSVGWLEAKRQTSDQALGYETALLQRTTSALSNVTGVDINEEMTLMMELERSFNASSTLISTIDRMLESLLQAVR
ncbi:flagellar biosynthesis protein FlgK [Bosea sp. Root381]|uniref:flagellar hook-associated protein FlgK n=1 Tax=Bosea sp. Root381 TaxID=1736524 RepID=UPI0006F7AF95|nr:flagellar hook-associated protein FlgK [Bosea sp. Root381]KRE15737.1 flagellar biosynthesis protein FlgK [Bosea sp. Root381]